MDHMTRSSLGMSANRPCPLRKSIGESRKCNKLPLHNVHQLLPHRHTVQREQTVSPIPTKTSPHASNTTQMFLLTAGSWNHLNTYDSDQWYIAFLFTSHPKKRKQYRCITTASKTDHDSTNNNHKETKGFIRINNYTITATPSTVDNANSPKKLDYTTTGIRTILLSYRKTGPTRIGPGMTGLKHRKKELFLDSVFCTYPKKTKRSIVLNTGTIS